MSAFDRSVAQVIAGTGRTQTAVSADPGIVEGVVLGVTAEGMLFTLEFDNHVHTFGPAPWPMSRIESSGDPAHDHGETAPTAGWRCLVVFVLRAGRRVPWVVAVWPG